MTIIKGLQCGINGCKTSKLKRHTHTFGDLSRSQADQRYIQDLEAFARMRGESVSQYTIPGGSIDDINNNLRAKVKQETKKAKEFRKRVSKEMDEMKKRGEKPNESKAIEAVKKKR